MVDPLELAWAAGLFEGEGSVRINKPTAHSRNLGSLLVDVPNGDESIPQFFADRWGGSVAYYEPIGSRREHWRWRAASTKARRFLVEVLPYLRTEKYRYRAILGIEYQDQKFLGNQSNRPDDYAEQQWIYYWRMAELNLRGVRDEPIPAAVLPSDRRS